MIKGEVLTSKLNTGCDGEYRSPNCFVSPLSTLLLVQYNRSAVSVFDNMSESQPILRACMGIDARVLANKRF